MKVVQQVNEFSITSCDLENWYKLRVALVVGVSVRTVKTHLRISE
jgi:hypothetical protein